MIKKPFIKCNACKQEVDYLWLAKDGKDYCNHCYDTIFYPAYYGFSRTDFQEGKAGYDINGKPLHKIH